MNSSVKLSLFSATPLHPESSSCLAHLRDDIKSSCNPVVENWDHNVLLRGAGDPNAPMSVADMNALCLLSSAAEIVIVILLTYIITDNLRHCHCRIWKIRKLSLFPEWICFDKILVHPYRRCVNLEYKSLSYIEVFPTGWSSLIQTTAPLYNLRLLLTGVRPLFFPYI